jgi:pimeloyl-ACP methyl ester carboxylesterase
MIVLLLLVAAAGATYQAIENRADARRSPEIGRLADAGGLRLKLNCAGAGSPTVILEGGLGDPSLGWRRVQPEIAKLSRVCSYDRAGYGGSDAGPMPRTSARIATELHVLLQNAGEQPPYVLVGHSFGGYNVRVYNGRYSSEVAGMVLVDSTQEDQYALLPAAWKQIGAEQLKRYSNQARFAPVFVGMGVLCLMLYSRGIHDPYSYLMLQQKYLAARASELEYIQVSAEQARAAGNIGDKALVVLTAGINSDQALSSGLSAADFAAYQHVWTDVLQVRLANLSTRGKRIIVEDSGHNIPGDWPDAVVKAVRDVLPQ